MSQELRLKNVDETRNYFLEETKQNELMSRKHKIASTTLNYIEHFLILGFTIGGCILISAFASLIGIHIGITSSAIELRICAIFAAIEKYKSIITKKKKEHNKIVLLAKSKFNSIEGFYSVISHDEFILINNVLKEYNQMKEELKHLMTKTILSYYCLKCRKNKESKYLKVARAKNRRIKLLSKFEGGDRKKLRFIKEQEARGV